MKKEEMLDDVRAFLHDIRSRKLIIERTEAYLVRCDRVNRILEREPLDTFSLDELEELRERIKCEVARREKKPTGHPKMSKAEREHRESFAHDLHTSLTGDNFNFPSDLADEFIGCVFHVSARTAQRYRQKHAPRTGDKNPKK